MDVLTEEGSPEEFDCPVDEEPAPGNPVTELHQHYPECWWDYAARAMHRLGPSGLRRLFAGVYHSKGVPAPLVEDHVPPRGLPDLCGDYGIPALHYEERDMPRSAS